MEVSLVKDGVFDVLCYFFVFINGNLYD